MGGRGTKNQLDFLGRILVLARTHDFLKSIIYLINKQNLLSISKISKLLHFGTLKHFIIL